MMKTTIKNQLKEIFLLTERGRCARREFVDILKFSGLNINFKICPHVVHRLSRRDNRGSDITRNELTSMVDAAIPQIITSLANQEIHLNDEFVISNTKNNLNLVATFESAPQEKTYELRGITTMRKAGFRPKFGDEQFKVRAEEFVRIANEEINKALSEMKTFKVNV